MRRRTGPAGPVIAIVNTWSDINPCHAHFPAAGRGREARRAAGRRLSDRTAGAVAVARTSSSRRPCSTATCWRWRPRSCCARHPVDGAVLMGGCDKTTPGLLMGAISMDLPCDVPAGRADAARQSGGARCWAPAPTPGNTGTSAAPARSASTNGRRSRRGIARSYGHCMTMGTAATMTAHRRCAGPVPDRRLVDPGGRTPTISAWPPPCGRRAVEMVHEDLRPSRVLSRAAFDNALTVAMAMGCSTNAIIHLIAMSRRAGISAGPRRLPRAPGAGAGARQHPPVGRPLPDGGLLLRRRPARPDGADGRPARPAAP